LYGLARQRLKSYKDFPMSTIVSIKTSNGQNRYKAKIQRAGFRTRCKNFPTRRSAEQWATKTESEMLNGIYVDRSSLEKITLRDALERYIKEFTLGKKGVVQELGRIRRWQAHPIADCALANICTQDFLDFIDERREEDEVCDQTLKLDLAPLNHMYEVARQNWKYPLAENPAKLIRGTLQGAKKRNRRISDKEISLVARYLRKHSGNVYAHFHWLIAIETAARKSELLRIEWKDINLQSGLVHIYETKNGTPRAVLLSRKAIEIIQTIPRTSDPRLLPTTPNAIHCGWQKIKAKFRKFPTDLRLHDARHERTSRLFEAGWELPDVQVVTGHKSIQMLMWYTKLNPHRVARKLQAMG